MKNAFENGAMCDSKREPKIFLFDIKMKAHSRVSNCSVRNPVFGCTLQTIIVNNLRCSLNRAEKAYKMNFGVILYNFVPKIN